MQACQCVYFDRESHVLLLLYMSGLESRIYGQEWQDGYKKKTERAADILHEISGDAFEVVPQSSIFTEISEWTSTRNTHLTVKLSTLISSRRESSSVFIFIIAQQ